jgi:predicted DNA-binding transcriptional regulator AlpA
MSASTWLALPGFAEAVRQAIEQPADDGWLDSEQAAEYLGVSRARIHNLVSQEALPRHGGKSHKLLFRRVDLDAYVDRRRP